MQYRASLSSPSPHRRSGIVLGGVAAAATLAVGVFVACTSTTDPRAGTSSGGPSTSGGPGATSGAPGGSGLVDATVPEGPVDCGPRPGGATTFTKPALIAAAADCAAFHTCNFQNAATALRATVRAQVAAPDDGKKTAAQGAWRAAIDAWSTMEFFQFGPVAPTVVDKYHGRSLRSFIHPWPDLNRCQIETQVATKQYAQGWNLVLPSGRGFFGVEYLLFYPGADTVCLSNSTAAQTWATLSPAALGQAKNDYAVALVDNLVALALELRNVWAPEGENFKPKLVAAEGYGSEQEALNVIAWSLMYFEQEIKDLKLAPRAGISTSAPNPETPFGHVDIDNVRTNIRAFRALFQGCGADSGGLGFDDWLITSGNAALAQEILTLLGQVETAANAFPSFETATQQQFLDLYNVVRPLSTLLKTQFFGSASPLNLKLPASAASDTD
jgi:uncharacterized protein